MPGVTVILLASFNKPYFTKRPDRGYRLGGMCGMSDLEDLFLTMRDSIAATLARLLPPDQVEDVIQDTYLRLRGVAESHEIQHPRSYLYRTARNLALDSLKSAGYSRSVEWCEQAGYSVSSHNVVEESIDSSTRFQHFCESLEALPPRAREVFVMKKVYGYSQREIAEQLAIAESTVEKHVALGARRCSEEMQNHYTDVGSLRVSAR